MDILYRYRITGKRPTLHDKIAATKCADELDGLRRQVIADGRMTDEIRGAIALRKAEIGAKK